MIYLVEVLKGTGEWAPAYDVVGGIAVFMAEDAAIECAQDLSHQTPEGAIRVRKFATASVVWGEES